MNRHTFPPARNPYSLHPTIRVLHRNYEARTTPDADELARVIAYAKAVDRDRDALRDRVADLEHWRWALVLVLLALVGVGIVSRFG